MKRRVALAVGAFVVVGCSGVEQNRATDGSVATLAPRETTTERSGPEPADQSTPASDPLADPKYGERVVSERGTLVKEVGQLAAMGDVGNNVRTVVMAEFTVTEIQPNFQCPAEDAQPAVNGNYIAVTIELTTTPELAEVQRTTGTSSWSFTEGFDLKVLSPDGTLENPHDDYGVTENAASCLGEADRLPPEMGPGETAVGTIVLDSAHESGTLLLQPSHYTPGRVDCCWEWAF